MAIDSKWFGYYGRTAQSNQPWETLGQAVDSFEKEGASGCTAIDLGCGVGKDAAHLVNRGWKVIAIDAEKIAEEFLQRKIDPEKRDQLTFVVSKYEDYAFAEKVELVNASYALPFCSPSHVKDVMQRITQAILPGGRFAGHFFGLNDSWSKDPAMTFVSKEELLNYFEGSYVIERLEEKEYDGPSGSGPKHWHVFEIIAKKV